MAIEHSYRVLRKNYPSQLDDARGTPFFQTANQEQAERFELVADALSKRLTKPQYQLFWDMYNAGLSHLASGKTSVGNQADSLREAWLEMTYKLMFPDLDLNAQKVKKALKESLTEQEILP